jgi:1-acyl-sn-glycerol-3-phosphate acyltransferase
MSPDPTRFRRRSTERAQRSLGQAEQVIKAASRPLAKYGFPWRAPTVPRGVEVPEKPSTLGPDYDTDWARRPSSVLMRAALIAGPIRMLTVALARPEVLGLDRLTDLQRVAEPEPVIFAPDHHSHLDTMVMIRAIPAVWRRDLVVAAAADYFFDRRWKAAFSALALNAIPIDREATGRRSAELFRDLLEEGQSLLIYPEGGRSPDGWGQPFKGGAAYLASRTGTPIIPVHIEGTGAVFGKGMRRPRPGRTRVVFGRPLRAGPDESTRHLNQRLETEVARLAEESVSDSWSAARAAAAGSLPTRTGPAVSGWRRSWLLAERRRAEVSGRSSRPQRSWPDLGQR